MCQKILHAFLYLLLVILLTFGLLYLSLEAAIKEQENEDRKQAELCIQWGEEGTLTADKLPYCH